MLLCNTLRAKKVIIFLTGKLKLNKYPNLSRNQKVTYFMYHTKLHNTNLDAANTITLSKETQKKTWNRNHITLLKSSFHLDVHNMRHMCFVCKKNIIYASSLLLYSLKARFN